VLAARARRAANCCSTREAARRATTAATEARHVAAAPRARLPLALAAHPPSRACRAAAPPPLGHADARALCSRSASVAARACCPWQVSNILLVGCNGLGIEIGAVCVLRCGRACLRSECTQRPATCARRAAPALPSAPPSCPPARAGKISLTGGAAAKNLALAGVKSLTLWDPKPVALPDLSSQFYFGEADVGKNRAEISAAALRDLNPYCEIKILTGELTGDTIKPYQVGSSAVRM